MRMDAVEVKRLARERGLSLNALLASAGVSKTAFYHLARKDSVLPASIRTIAAALGVRPSKFLSETHPDTERLKRIFLLSDRIAAKNPRLDQDNIRLTLILLEREPLERLRRSLIRGR